MNRRKQISLIKANKILNIHLTFKETKMKKLILLFLTLTFATTTFAQKSQEENLVKNVVLAFQKDFNEGGFQKPKLYTTSNWEHINPGGGITRGRAEVLKEVRAVHQTFLKGVSLTIERISNLKL